MKQSPDIALRRGRPRKQVDEPTLEQMASMGCTTAEMAETLGVSPDTLERNYAASIKRGAALRNYSLRRRQLELAMEGNPTMLIWLGKQLLGQRDKAPPEDELKDEDTAIRRVVVNL